jgi:hypothetical protein
MRHPAGRDAEVRKLIGGLPTEAGSPIWPTVRCTVIKPPRSGVAIHFKREKHLWESQRCPRLNADDSLVMESTCLHRSACYTFVRKPLLPYYLGGSLKPESRPISLVGPTMHMNR